MGPPMSYRDQVIFAYCKMVLGKLLAVEPNFPKTFKVRFAKCDPQSRGFVTKEEFCTLFWLKRYGSVISKLDAEAISEFLDTAGDDKISYSQAVVQIEKLCI